MMPPGITQGPHVVPDWGPEYKINSKPGYDGKQVGPKHPAGGFLVFGSNAYDKANYYCNK
jgi:hypothetical protein